MLNIPDPEYTASKRSQANFLLAVVLAAVVIGVISMVYALDWVLGFDLVTLGLSPRSLSGSLGILSAPLLHGSFEHLVSNLGPLFLGLVLILYLYPNASSRALPLIYLGSGGLAWLTARDAIHIGASGVVYGLMSFLLMSGILRRDVRSMSVSLLVIFLYGFFIWGVFPLDTTMSWELHMAGTVIGLGSAWRYRYWDRVPLKHYDWESEEDDERD